MQLVDSQLEKPLTKGTPNFDFGDNTFAERFVVMEKLTGPIIGLNFMKNKGVFLEMAHGLTYFPHLAMQIKTTSEMSANPQAVLTDDALALPPRTTKTITAFVDHHSEWNTTGAATPLEKFMETASLLFWLSTQGQQ